MRHSLLLLLAIFAATCCFKVAAQSTAKDFVHRHGRDLVVGLDQKVVRFQGVNFSNWYWMDTVQPDHHGEVDFDRVRDLGLNTIRFCMNYRWIEDDAAPFMYKEEGWRWLDLMWPGRANVGCI